MSEDATKVVTATTPTPEVGVDGDPDRRSWTWFLTQNILCYPLIRLCYRFKAYHVDRVPLTGGCLMVSNHQSFLDPVLIGIALRRPMAYLARHDLFRNPIFGWWIRNLHAFPIHQGKGQAGPLKQSVKLLKSGWMLNVFPEGERTPDGELCDVQGGVTLVVRRADVPVVPCVIEGAFDVWPRDKALPKPWGKITVHYGEPIDMSGMSADEIKQRIDAEFKTLMAEAREVRRG